MNKQATLSAERQRLLALRLKGSAGAPIESRRIAKRAAGQHPPLSVGQHQMWVLDQITPLIITLNEGSNIGARSTSSYGRAGS